MPQNSSKKIDNRRGRWPFAAEEAREEALATAARIRELVLRSEEALIRGHTSEALRILALINDKANYIEDVLRKAGAGEWRDS
jgi:hypothetical protein